MRGLITAIRTLTILPVPGRDAERMATSLPYFPVVGGLVGGLVAAAMWAVETTCGWPMGSGVVGVAVASVVTAALHLDGLADAFDALGGRSMERRLAIMKDSHVGSYGMTALIVILMAKTAAMARLAEMHQYTWIVVPFVVSRTMQVQLAAMLPYARAEGGTGRCFIDGASLGHVAAACVPAVILCLAAGLWHGLVVLAVCGILCVAVAQGLKRLFGGVTGDLLGAGSEIFETIGLMVLAACTCC